MSSFLCRIVGSVPSFFFGGVNREKMARARKVKQNFRAKTLEKGGWSLRPKRLQKKTSLFLVGKKESF